MRLSTFLLLILCYIKLSSQEYSYEVRLEPIVIDSLGGLHSFAFGTNDEDWLLIGGRLDGLHERQPFAAFDYQGYNNQLIVVNPITEEIWKENLSSLSRNLQEQLTSSNFQFYQTNNELILTGGYGFSPSKNEHITFPFITIIDIPELIQSIKNNEDITHAFTQIEDEQFAVTGGRLNKIDNTFFLVGGHKFTGRYNPMGPNQGPGFKQDYTYEIRKFNIVKKLDQVTIKHIPAIHDEMHLRRRDYNLAPLIMEGDKKLVAYAGVFKESSDSPWLYPVMINKVGHTPIEEFKQLYNHYHCANLPIYNKSTNEMHTLFFGGIAQFYKDDNVIIQDNDIPFVSSITDVSYSNDTFREQLLETSMPTYLGAASEFILAPGIRLSSNDVVDGDDLSDEMPVGYIYGGIQSSQANIFWINDGTQSLASATIYKVHIKKSKNPKAQKQDLFAKKLFIYPNPDQSLIRTTIELEQSVDIRLNVKNSAGKLIETHQISKSEVTKGLNFFTFQESKVEFGMYTYEFQIGDHLIIRKVSWSE